MRAEELLAARFKCAKCGGSGAKIRKLAMTGAGIFDRMMDWQRNRYYFVSCSHCGYTEVYDATVLDGKGDSLRDIIDLIFGG